jgi:hypothetical protein
VHAAAGSAGTVAPSEWRVGDYRGQQYRVFPHVIAPGATDTQTFAIGGGGSWSVADRYLKRTDSQTLHLTTAPVATESASSFNAPDYLIDITDQVRRHPSADLMVVRARYPHSQLDANGDYRADQGWNVLTYNWTDVNHDRALWTDRNHDGVVDHADDPKRTTIDGFPLIDLRARPARADGRRRVHRPPARDPRRGDPEDRLHDRDRLVHHSGLAVVDGARNGARQLLGHDHGSDGHAVRHV